MNSKSFGRNSAIDRLRADLDFVKMAAERGRIGDGADLGEGLDADLDRLAGALKRQEELHAEQEAREPRQPRKMSEEEFAEFIAIIKPVFEHGRKVADAQAAQNWKALKDLGQEGANIAQEAQEKLSSIPGPYDTPSKRTATPRGVQKAQEGDAATDRALVFDAETQAEIDRRFEALEQARKPTKAEVSRRQARENEIALQERRRSLRLDFDD